MTNDFKVYNGSSDLNIKELDINEFENIEDNEEIEEDNIENYFKTDYYTNDYIHFLILKTNPYDKRINVVDKKKNINNSKFIFKHYTKIFNLLYDHYQHTYIYFLSMI